MKKILLLVFVLFNFFSFNLTLESIFSFWNYKYVAFAWDSNSCACWDCEFWCPWDLDDAIERNNADDTTRAENDLTSSNFTINVDSISPWINAEGSNTQERVNWLLWKVIQNMMIALGTLSVLIMTVWSWYIILHNWQDELLSKWKSIFMAWVYAMIIALSSYLIIYIVRQILYSS